VIRIEAYEPRHLDAVVNLSLRAWGPVFVSIKDSMEDAVYDAFYPDGWLVSQREAVEGVCAAKDTSVWVSLDGDRVSGFVAVKQHSETYAEIYMIAVDPECQRRGIATALTEFALEWMRGRGVSVAMVETGADPGHGPARGTYEKTGFRLWPVARYFKKL
jgi:ribosomal protein S18 acetylase RimI-like enzyme